MVRFYCGLDLGQSSDYSAFSIIESVESSYNLRRLERTRGLSYPDVVSKVSSVMKSRELIGNATLIIDYSGVGRAVYDLFKVAGLSPIAVTTTGGDSVHHDGDEWHVPKRDLISSLQVALQSGKLHFSERLKHAGALRSELLNFQMKISDAGHDSYAARGSGHDDLVLSVALAAWYATRQSSQNQHVAINFSNLYELVESDEEFEFGDHEYLSSIYLSR